MKRILFGLSELVFFLALPVFGILAGGGFFLLKIGETPTGWEWSKAPAVALAVFIAIVGAICGYGAIKADMYHWTIRAYLGLVWIAQVGTNCLIIPVYFSASRMAAQSGSMVSFQQAVDNLLKAGPSGWIEWGASLSMTLTGELGLCGLLLVMAAMSKEKVQEDRKETVRTIGEESALVLDAVKKSEYSMLTRNEIQEVTGLPRGKVDRITKELVSEGAFRTDGATRNTKFILVDLLGYSHERHSRRQTSG